MQSVRRGLDAGGGFGGNLVVFSFLVFLARGVWWFFGGFFLVSWVGALVFR